VTRVRRFTHPKNFRAFDLHLGEPAKAAIGKRVTIVDYFDGRLSIRYNGAELAYRTFDKVCQVDQGAIADNKHLRAVLAMILDEQLRRGPKRRSRAGATSVTLVSSSRLGFFLRAEVGRISIAFFSCGTAGCYSNTIGLAKTSVGESRLGNVAHGPEIKHDLRSVTKSVISLLVGITLDRKLI